MTPLNVLQPAHESRSLQGIRSLLLKFYRFAVIAVIVLLIHRHHARLRIDGDAPITLEEVRTLLPRAGSIRLDPSDRLGLFVLDPLGNPLGYVLRTSPLSDKITGYAGPTDTLIALDAGMHVIGIRIRSSWDTKTHVHDVANDQSFMSLWNGKTWEQVAGTDPKSAGIEGVSGASLTSLAIANGIQQRFKSVSQSPSPSTRIHFSPRDIGLLLVIAAALLFSFTSLRGKPWIRRAFQFILIAYVGFYNGQLLGLSLLSGWSANGLPWQLAPGLILLAAAALAVPWSTRRAVYCSHLCPHGAAQEWIGRISKRKWSLPRGLERGIRWLPGSLIALAITLTILNTPFDLASIEPFDAYLLKSAGIATITIAVVGLIASGFVPMAYCKFGCPTGLLLNFVRSHGSADRFTRRDLAAALLVLLASVLYLQYDLLHRLILRS